MLEVRAMSPLTAAACALCALLAGAYLTALIERMLSVRGRGHRVSRRDFGLPLYQAALRMRQEVVHTERPDSLLALLAPASYGAAATAALSVVPLGASLAIADVHTGIVLFGAAEAFAIVAVFMHGWSFNSQLSLIGAYRFVALGLSYELLSMFVLIAAALPARSLQVSLIVDSQARVWNVLRQPLGLPLWIVVMLGVSFWGPLDLADSRDLAGGTSLESSGRERLLWQLLRRAMLAVFAGMGAAMFLGGWHGPLLPGWLWMLLKTLALLSLALWLGQRVGRMHAERVVRAIWLVLLPLSFVGLVIAGLGALP